MQYMLDPLLVAQPTIYRILYYRPPPALDPISSYAKACGALLRACGEAGIAYERLLEVLARTGTTLLATLVPAFSNAETITTAEVSTEFSSSGRSADI